jgi:hypothetical protein
LICSIEKAFFKSVKITIDRFHDAMLSEVRTRTFVFLFGEPKKIKSMKPKLLAVLFLGLASISAHAMQSVRDPSLTAMRKDSSSTYVIKYIDNGTSNVLLTMKDDDGRTLLRRNIKNQNSFSIPVNFSSMEHGSYHVDADNGTKKASVVIHYNNNSEPTYTRVVSLGDNMYLLSSAHIGRQTLMVKVYDENMNVIFDEQRTINGQVAILFNLAGVSGRPSFEVTETSGNSLMLPGNPIMVSMLKPTFPVIQKKDLR